MVGFILVILAACTIASTLKCDTLANGQQVCNNLEEIKEKDIKEAEKEGIALHNMPSTPPKPTTTGIPIRSKEEQDEMDHYWISYVHAYAVGIRIIIKKKLLFVYFLIFILIFLYIFSFINNKHVRTQPSISFWRSYSRCTK